MPMAIAAMAGIGVERWLVPMFGFQYLIYRAALFVLFVGLPAVLISPIVRAPREVGGTVSAAAVPAGARRRSASKLFIVGLVILIVGVAAVIIVSQSRYTLTQSESAIVMQFGQIRSVNSTPGVHFKIPFVQQVTYVDRGFRVSDTNAVEYLTSHQERILVRAATRWRIVDPQSFFLTLNNEGIRSPRLAQLVVQGLRQRITVTSYDALFSADRDAIINKVRNEVQAQADELGWGIEVIEISAEVSRPKYIQ